MQPRYHTDFPGYTGYTDITGSHTVLLDVLKSIRGKIDMWKIICQIQCIYMLTTSTAPINNNKAPHFSTAEAVEIKKETFCNILDFES